jgi:hypothetical protein
MASYRYSFEEIPLVASSNARKNMYVMPGEKLFLNPKDRKCS